MGGGEEREGVRGVDDTTEELAQGFREIGCTHALAEAGLVAPWDGLLEEDRLTKAGFGEGDLLFELLWGGLLRDEIPV